MTGAVAAVRRPLAGFRQDGLGCTDCLNAAPTISGRAVAAYVP
jgi:hypothetical protein